MPVRDGEACEGCGLLARRAFLAEGAAIAAGPARAAALSITRVGVLRRAGNDLTYPIPAQDGAQIDHDNQVIVVRYEAKAYVFNLACPHQNTALRWQPEDNQFQCPRHHSRYTPDGEFVSGRATRGMDRFAVRKDGTNIVADIATLYRQDQDQAQWDAAFIAV